VFECEVGRETTTFTLTTPKENLTQSVAFLGDVLTNSLFNKNQIEAERAEIVRAASHAHVDQLASTLE